MQPQFDPVQALRDLVDERDKRYEQRFKEQQLALETAFRASERIFDAAISSAKEAVTKAEVATEKRLEGLNEFRNTLKDQQADLMPRREAEQRLTALNDKIDLLKQFSDVNYGTRGGQTEITNRSWLYLVLVVTVVLSLVGTATSIVIAVVK